MCQYRHVSIDLTMTCVFLNENLYIHYYISDIHYAISDKLLLTETRIKGDSRCIGETAILHRQREYPPNRQNLSNVVISFFTYQ